MKICGGGGGMSSVGRISQVFRLDKPLSSDIEKVLRAREREGACLGKDKFLPLASLFCLDVMVM